MSGNAPQDEGEEQVGVTKHSLTDLLQGYGSDDSSHQEMPDAINHNNCSDDEERAVRPVIDDRGVGMSSPPQKEKEEEQEEELMAVDNVEDRRHEYEEYVASLPEFFKSSSQAEVDGQRVEMVVQKWIEMAEKGYFITEELRKRSFYKSPDMMIAMLDKFKIDDGGSFLSESMDVGMRLGEVRKAWNEYEAQQKKRAESNKSRMIEFQRGEVSAAVAAAQAAAAAAMARKQR